jgi:hypothetical protein
MKNDDNGNHHIVRRNGKEISAYVGSYSNLATMELMRRHPGRLISIRELTFVHYGQVNEALMQLTRQQMWRAPNALLDEGRLSFIRYDDDWPHKIVGIKMFNPRTDKTPFNVWWQRVKDRKIFTDAKLDMIKRLYRSLT